VKHGHRQSTPLADLEALLVETLLSAEAKRQDGAWTKLRVLTSTV
jgi:hypothetical protein